MFPVNVGHPGKPVLVDKMKDVQIQKMLHSDLFGKSCKCELLWKLYDIDPCILQSVCYHARL